VSRLNTELFKKIHEVVSANPQRHDQATWEGQSVGDCGTTRCVAGWAVHLATGQKVFRWESGVPNVLLSGATASPPSPGTTRGSSRRWPPRCWV
jgi:hypothetical protein